MRRAGIAFAVIIIAVVVVAVTRSGGGVSRLEVATRAPIASTAGPGGDVMDAERASEEAVAALAAQQAEDDAAEARAQADREAQQAAADALNRPAPASAPSSGCCTHSDAWWQGVAVCEQGGRNDPYYGYFSFMDGSQGGKPWADQVAAGNALLNAVGHEVGPWAEACVRAGYAASPGG